MCKADYSDRQQGPTPTLPGQSQGFFMILRTMWLPSRWSLDIRVGREEGVQNCKIKGGKPREEQTKDETSK